MSGSELATIEGYPLQRHSDQVSIAVIFNIGGVYDDLMADLNAKVYQIPDSGRGI